MREIKFRAWDEKNQAMIYPKGILFDGRVVNFMCGMLEPFDGYKLMQYTGLKDKNKKEIYEGDIVKVNLRFFDIVDQKCRVIFHNGSFGLQYGYSLDYFKPLAAWDDIEVIGNIYENPELLGEASV